ncbi:MAG: hypothetical protein EBY17_05305, partial [Acidobacteriia bacterium]|nr:hypothetical protein [Terriglobia bacterium]
MIRLTRVLLAVVSCAALEGALCAQTDWPTYGHDPGNQRHSPLKQITAGNVSKLTRAWTYHLTVEAPTGAAPVQGEVPVAGGRGPAGRAGRGGGGRGRTSEASP